MKITCGSCGAKYTVSDEKVQGKTVKVKCRKCGAVIVVSSTGEVQTTGAGGSHAGPPPSAGASYTVSVSDTDQRTMTLAQIIDAYNEGTIDAETFVWAEGMDDWQPLKDVDAIVDALHDAAAAEGGGDLGQTVAMNNPADSYRPGGAVGSYPPAVGSYPPAAAAPAPDRLAPDRLGGTVAMAQSPLGGGGIAASAGGGGGGGFFAASAGGAYGGSSFSDVSAPVAGGNGQPRTEDSAIFSLNMLTSKVGGTTSAPVSTTSATSSEDSGLIDLKALAQGMGNESSAGAASTPAPMAADALFPLGAPPPQALAPMPAIDVTPQPSGGRGLILGMAALVVVMGAALLFILVRDSGEQPTPSTSAAAPTPAPTPTIADEPDEPDEPSTPATASASASASASAAPKVARYPGPRPVGGTTQPAPGPKTAQPKPAGGPCGCSPDDLMCHMRCSQKKK